MFVVPGLNGVCTLDKDPARHGASGGDLDRRIAAAEARHPAVPTPVAGQGENQGWAMGVDFVGVVLVSAFIGWAVDRWAGGHGWWHGPWAMLGFLLLGFAAGVRGVMKLAAKGAGAAGGSGGMAPLPDDEDDD